MGWGDEPQEGREARPMRDGRLKLGRSPTEISLDADRVIHMRPAGARLSRCQVPWLELEAVTRVGDPVFCPMCWPANLDPFGYQSGPWPGQLRRGAG